MLHPAMRMVAAMIAALWLMSSLAPASLAAQEQTAETEKLQVVATFSILADVVANVGGDAIELTTIVPVGGDAHSFEPTPDQVAGVSEADLIVSIGIGFEPWLEDMIGASGAEGRNVVVTEGLDLIDGFEEEHEHEESDEHENEHKGEDHADEETGAIDPHVWGDVANMIAITATVSQALVAADPANTATYEANAAAYTTQLQTLDTFVRDQVGTLPVEQRQLVTSHDTFGYFARAYEFEVVGTAIGSLTTESGDPSAEEIANLVGEIEATGVPVIFAENVSNPALIESIASEAGVEVGPALYTDALGEAGSDGETYDAMMRYNVTSIVTALSV
ncbi:MAG: zinc ABC transporter substrate-binding protein [Thermomicrobiales bacterium]